MDTMIIDLTTPLTFGKEEIKEIKLREPTVADLNALGYPFTFQEGGTYKMETKVCFDYLVRLSGLPQSVLNKMALKDATTAYNQFIDFFIRIAGFSR